MQGYIMVTAMGRPNKGQHKVPRIYLAAFTDTKGQVWVADNKLNLYSGKPGEVLKERDYYTVRFPTGQGSLVIETKFLGGIETAYADVYREKLSQHRPLTPEGRATMAIFIASMLGRGPRMRDAMENSFQQITEMMDKTEQAVATMTEEKRRALANYQSIGAAEETIPGSVVREWAKDIPSLHSASIPNTITSAAPIIYQMKWNYMVRRGPAPFLTSDNPAVLANPDLPPKSFLGPVLLQEGAELSLPLSPDLTLFAGWKMHRNGHYIPIPATIVDEINCRTMRFGETLVSNERAILEQQIEWIKKSQAKPDSKMARP